MAFVTNSNRPQPRWQTPRTAHLTAPGTASEVPPLLMRPWGGGVWDSKVCVPKTPPTRCSLLFRCFVFPTMVTLVWGRGASGRGAGGGGDPHPCGKKMKHGRGARRTCHSGAIQQRGACASRAWKPRPMDGESGGATRLLDCRRRDPLTHPSARSSRAPVWGKGREERAGTCAAGRRTEGGQRCAVVA